MAKAERDRKKQEKKQARANLACLSFQSLGARIAVEEHARPAWTDLLTALLALMQAEQDQKAACKAIRRIKAEMHPEHHSRLADIVRSRALQLRPSLGAGSPTHPRSLTHA